MTNFNENLESVDWGEVKADAPKPQATALLINKDNKSVYLIGVWALAITSVASLVGICILSYFNREVPQALVALGSAAIGALSGLFARN
jgi:hypothetical protein